MRPQLLDRGEAEVVQRGPVGVHEPVLPVADGDRLADELEQLGELRTLAVEDPLAEWKLRRPTGSASVEQLVRLADEAQAVGHAGQVQQPLHLRWCP